MVVDPINHDFTAVTGSPARVTGSGCAVVSSVVSYNALNASMFSRHPLPRSAPNLGQRWFNIDILSSNLLCPFKMQVLALRGCSPGNSHEFTYFDDTYGIGLVSVAPIQ